ncbi:MAG: hypothetical protein AABX11_07490 [Nanoarchaeota archaeon]
MDEKDREYFREAPRFTKPRLEEPYTPRIHTNPLHPKARPHPTAEDARQALIQHGQAFKPEYRSPPRQ